MLDGFKADGPSRGDILEVVANVVVNPLSNYINNVARTEIAFPVVALQIAA